MSSAALQPTTDPAESLARIVEGLCEAIAARFENDLPASPIKRLAWAQLRHLAGWFAALMAEFRAGLLAAAPASRRPAPAAPALSRTPAVPPHLSEARLGLSTPADAGEGGLWPGGAELAFRPGDWRRCLQRCRKLAAASACWAGCWRSGRGRRSLRRYAVIGVAGRETKSRPRRSSGLQPDRHSQFRLRRHSRFCPRRRSWPSGGRRLRRLSRGRPGSGRFLPRRPSRLRTRRPAFFAMA